MTLFVVIAALMVAIALACVLLPLLWRQRSAGIARETSNVALLRDQLAELDVDLAAGTLSRGQYDEARRELEARVLDESRAPDVTAAGAPPAAAWTASMLAGGIPIAALVLYVALGNFEAFAPGGVPVAKRAGEHDVTPEQVDRMAESLAAKLAQNPDNVEGWVMLARTYYSRQRHAEAARAFARAVELVPGNADLLADYADALAAAQGGLAGKPEELIRQALAADPTQWKALALAGTVAFDRKDYAQAVAYWEKLKATVPPDAPIAGSIDSSIAEARQLGGLPPATALTSATPASKAPPAVTPPAVTSPAGVPPASVAVAPGAAGVTSPAAQARSSTVPGASAAAGVAGTVTLAPALAGSAAPADTVYIFARPAQGSRAPLAILRRQVKDLPASFSLDDSMAMSPGSALSNFGEVVVGARVSRSGNAMPRSGDLEGLSAPVRIGTTGLAVVIDRTLP